MPVNLAGPEVALVEVDVEDRVEGRDVGGHACHERCEQAGDGQAEQSVGQHVTHQQQNRIVVLEIGAGEFRIRDFGHQDAGHHAGDDHQEGDEHLHEGADDRRLLGGRE